MIEYLRHHCQYKTNKAQKQDYDKAPLKAKSYLLQEAEATSRLHKIRWCEANGVKVMGLQHDGILAGDHEEWSIEEISELMMIETAKSGYEIQITGDWVGGERLEASGNEEGMEIEPTVVN